MDNPKKEADLLIPRYEVISDWPGRKDFVVGEVVTLDKPFSPQYQMYEIVDCQGPRKYINSFFDMFPLQFKRLEWYEKRKIDEMPEYVKYWDTSLYVPVDRVCKFSDAPFNDTWTSTNFQPATKEEYETYKSKQP